MSPRKKNRKKTRRIEHLPVIEHKYYIFCEGMKTEPLYFEGIKKAIEQNPIYRNMVIINIEGVGAETIKVIEAAEAKVKSLGVKNAHIWCVYDKDSSPPERFNKVSEKARALNHSQNDVVYHAGWSNQCIEYWFILHFDYYDSDNDRKYYRKYLHKKFKDLGWNRYEKNNEELFILLSLHGNPNQAIEWAKQRLNILTGLTDSQSVPATKVHELVEELAIFFPDDLRSKYIKKKIKFSDKNGIELPLDATQD